MAWSAFGCYRSGGSAVLHDCFGNHFNSAADWEKAHLAARDNAKWKALYAKIVPLTETGHREILSVIG
jgi:hypothetical protein